MSSKIVSAAVIASFILAGAPVVAANAAAKTTHKTTHKMSCYHEAKHAGLKTKKDIHAYVKKCVAERRAAARKHARSMKHEKKGEHKPAAPASSSESK